MSCMVRTATRIIVWETVIFVMMGLSQSVICHERVRDPPSIIFWWGWGLVGVCHFVFASLSTSCSWFLLYQGALTRLCQLLGAAMVMSVALSWGTIDAVIYSRDNSFNTSGQDGVHLRLALRIGSNGMDGRWSREKLREDLFLPYSLVWRILKGIDQVMEFCGSIGIQRQYACVFQIVWLVKYWSSFKVVMKWSDYIERISVASGTLTDVVVWTLKLVSLWYIEC